MKQKKKVPAFGASNSTRSINKQLSMHAAEVLRDEMGANVEILTLDLNDFDMPIYSPEREAAGVPEAAHRFIAMLGNADGIIISFAEYNGNYTAAYKNVFDWCSRVQMRVFQGKPLLLLATSSGDGGAKNVFKIACEAAPFFGGKLAASFNFGNYSKHVDAEGKLANPTLMGRLREALVDFYDAIEVDTSSALQSSDGT